MNATATLTPGYTVRLAIFFQTNAKGQRTAYRFMSSQLRSFRMSVSDAESFIAQDLADEIPSNPMKF